MMLCWLLMGGRRHRERLAELRAARGLVVRGIPTQQPRLDPQGNPPSPDAERADLDVGAIECSA